MKSGKSNLLRQGEKTIQVILKWIGVSRTSQQVQVALACQSFSQRRAVAETHGDNRNINMLRAGKEGQFKQYLSMNQIQEIEQTTAFL